MYGTDIRRSDRWCVGRFGYRGGNIVKGGATGRAGRSLMGGYPRYAHSSRDSHILGNADYWTEAEGQMKHEDRMEVRQRKVDRQNAAIEQERKQNEAKA